MFHAGRYVAGTLPDAAWRWGEFGVDVFFAVSGFVMMVAVPRAAGWRDFARRRAVRILPMYWLATLLMAALVWLAPSLFVSAVITLPHLASSLLLLPHVSPATGDVAPLLVPGWTLSYELFFYAVFALFLRTGDGVRALGATLVLGALFAAGHALPASALRTFLTQPLVFEFAFGLFAGYAWRRGWRCPPRWAWAVFAAAVAWFVAVTALVAWPAGEESKAVVRVLSAGVAGGWMTWALASVASLRGAVGRGLVALGDASYSLYLLHPFVVGAAWFAWQRAGLPAHGAFIALCLAASAAAGWIAWRVIEAPMTRRLRAR